MHVTEVYPRKIPDLFVGKPVIITGRFTGSPGGSIVISGKAGAEERRYPLAIGPGNTDQNPGIRTVWARSKIADLHDTAIRKNIDVSNDVRDTALEYALASQFTSFVAVDSLTRTAGDHGTSAAVPVPAPAGVRYDTTVQPGGDK